MQDTEGAGRIKREGRHDLPPPTYATDGAAALDLRASLDEPDVVTQHDTVLVP